MAPKMRRQFSGAASARVGEDGAWRLHIAPASAARAGAPTRRADVIVIGADARRVRACGAMPRDVCIEWLREGVVVSMICEGRDQNIEAAGAIVHEPLPDLYAALPLAQFDERARRFWRRVFLLVRIPGGRLLLPLLARASRNKP
jgi:hypothetical protein